MLCQEAVNGIRGIIINISSMSAVVSSVNRGEYCVSKAGISMLTRLYADRLAGEQIYVYEVRPGIIATDMTSVVREKYDSLFKQGICPIARWGNPEDIGNAVSILCSGKLKYSTGQVIDVDGGFHIQRL
jgi:3-oxoacyl-[acyl-carrier protein] reductase